MNNRRRNLVALSCLLFGLVGGTESRAQSDFKVTLLGTGTPIPYPNRFGPSTLVEAGDQNLLFDAGRGVPIRLAQHKASGGKIDVLFLTPNGSGSLTLPPSPVGRETVNGDRPH